MTGYKMSKFVNDELKKVGIKEIPPQMIYNYISKGYIKSEVVEGKRVVSEEVVVEWCEKYIGKKLSTVK